MKNPYLKLLSLEHRPALIFNEEGRIVLYNDAAVQKWGKELTGKTILGEFADTFKISESELLIKSVNSNNHGAKKDNIYEVSFLQGQFDQSRKLFLLSAHAEHNQSRYTHFLKTIHKISSRSYKYRSIPALARFVVNQLFNEEYDFYHVGLFLKGMKSDKNMVSLIAIAGESRELFQKYCDGQYTQSAHTGVIGKVLQSGDTEIINNTAEIDYYHSTPFFHGKSEICTPIFMNKEVMGVLNIESKVLTFFNEADAIFLSTVADLFAANLYRINTTREISQKNLKLQKYLDDLKITKEILELQTFDLKKSLVKGDEARQLIKRQNEMMQNKLKMGAELQKSLLPKRFPKIQQLRFSSKYQPNYHLGGDFFDVSMIGNQKVAILIADVSGYGVSAAMIAAMFKAFFNNYRRSSKSPALILKELNKEFCSIITTGEYITAFVGILDTKTFKMAYASAGHPTPFLFKEKNKSFEKLDSDGFFIGIFSEQEYKEKEVLLLPGDKILFYTDGAIDVTDKKGILLGKDRLENYFRQVLSSDKLIKNKINTLYSNIKKYAAKSTFDDDVTLLLLERTPLKT